VDPALHAYTKSHYSGQREGPLEAEAALDDRPHPGKAPTITIDATARLTSLACRKAKDLVYPHEFVDEAASGLPRS